MTDGTDRSLALMRGVGVLVLTVEVAVLVVTGVLLSFVYRPEAVAWTDVYATHAALTVPLLAALWASRRQHRPSRSGNPPHPVEVGGTTGAGARVLPPTSH